MKINETEQIIALLRRVAIDDLPIARHVALATRGKDIFHLSNKDFLEILEKYELEVNFDETIEDPSLSINNDTVGSILSDGMNLETFREELYDKENHTEE
jgi:hypothetical protein